MVTFLPIVARELYVAARQRNTYWTRVGASVIALGIMGGLVLVAAEIRTNDQGRLLFSILSTLAFLYCLFAGVSATADCLSEEKREGTLGLLFLTDLKGYDVVLGKFAASSLRSIYGLFAIVPMLALAFLLGGVTAGEVARVVVVLVNTLFFSLSTGVFVSAISRNERKAMFGTIGLVLFVATAPGLAAAALNLNSASAPLTGPERILLVPSPIFAFWLAFVSLTGRFLWGRELLYSLLCTHLLSWVLLAVSSAVLPRVCLDRPKTGRTLRWWESWQRWSYGETATRVTVRARLLDQNPFTWLAGRDRLKAKLVWLFLGALAVIWVPTWFVSDDTRVLAAVFLLFCAHCVLKIWMVSEICSRWVEDRQSGALELMLSSPLSVSEMARGQKLALTSQFAKAVGVVLALDLILWWFLATSYRDPSAPRLAVAIPAGMMALVADLVTLRWVAMWLALTCKNMSQALLGAWVRVLALPWLIYLGIYWSVALVGQFTGKPELDFSARTWAGFWLGIGLALDLLFGGPAKHNFLNGLRTLASEHFSPRQKTTLTQTAVELIRAGLASLGRRSNSGPRTESRLLWRRHAWLWLFLGTTLLAVGWLGWYRLSLSRQIQAHLRAIQRAGYPVTEDDLEKWHPHIPLQENIAAVVARATPQLLNVQWLPRKLQTNLPGLVRTEWPARSALLPVEMRQAISAFVSSNQPALKIIHEVRANQKSRYDEIWSRAQTLWWAPFGRGYEFINLLRLEAALRSEEGQPELSIESLNTLLVLIRSLTQEPFLQLRSWRSLGLNTAASILERLLSRHSLSDSQLQDLLGRFNELENPNRLTRALAGDRYIRIGLFESPPQRLLAVWAPGAPKWQTIGFGLLQGVRTCTGMRDRDFLLFLQTMAKYMEVAQLPFPESLAQANQLFRPVENQNGLPFDLTSRVLPNLPLILTWEAENDARLRAVRTGLALERYRLQNDGRLPDSLEALVPIFLKSVPRDPFDGKPLRYKRLAQGYVIYSVGKDGQDDGGQEWPGNWKKPSDVTFVVER